MGQAVRIELTYNIRESSNNSQRELLPQNITSYTEFKFPIFKRRLYKIWLIYAIFLHLVSDVLHNGLWTPSNLPEKYEKINSGSVLNESYTLKIEKARLASCLFRKKWYYLPTPPLGQDMTQGQFLSGV